MAEREQRVETWCPACGQPCAEGVLQRCIICRSLYCPRCAVSGYGREFCSARCRGFFFYGDAEEESEEEREND